jgi:hypothetical protein
MHERFQASSGVIVRAIDAWAFVHHCDRECRKCTHAEALVLIGMRTASYAQDRIPVSLSQVHEREFPEQGTTAIPEHFNEKKNNATLREESDRLPLRKVWRKAKSTIQSGKFTRGVFVVCASFDTSRLLVISRSESWMTCLYSLSDSELLPLSDFVVPDRIRNLPKRSNELFKKLAEWREQKHAILRFRCDQLPGGRRKRLNF